MNTSIIYSGSSTPLTTEENGTVIPFSNVVRRYGRNLKVSGGNVVIDGAGYYRGVVNITYVGTAIGDLNVRVYQDGVPIPYAIASATSIVGGTAQIGIPFEIKESCCHESTITVVASGVVVNVTNSAILIEKQ